MLPPFPDAALREVLGGCVAAWARGAAGDGEARLLYVDGFAGAELQFGSGVARAAEEETRAAAAVRALDSAAGGARANAVLVEEDPAYVQRVYADLERVAGGERLRATRDFASLAAGEAALVEADFAAVAAEVARFADGARSLFWLAPPSARKLPWEVLRPLVQRPGADVLLRLPAADFEKQSRHDSPVADLPGFVRRIVEGCSAMLGDAKHEWLPAWRAAARAGGVAAALGGVLGRFRRLLEAAAPGRIVRSEVLEADGAAAHLFLVTSDSAFALAFEAAARGETVPAVAAESVPPAEPVPPAEAEAPAAEEPQPVFAPAESVESAETGESAKIARTAGDSRDAGDAVLDLFPEMLPAGEEEAPAGIDLGALGESLAGRYAGRAVAWREVLGELAASGASAGEAKRILAALKRSGRAVYGNLKDEGDEIDFPSEPVAPPPRKRKRAAGDAGLFGADE
ncbi:MAG TPA: hypothetical protein VF746_11290 [Longimicrobium sp.]|jgi:hypothetical protein